MDFRVTSVRSAPDGMVSEWVGLVMASSRIRSAKGSDCGEEGQVSGHAAKRVRPLEFCESEQCEISALDTH